MSSWQRAALERQHVAMEVGRRAGGSRGGQTGGGAISAAVTLIRGEGTRRLGEAGAVRSVLPTEAGHAVIAVATTVSFSAGPFDAPFIFAQDGCKGRRPLSDARQRIPAHTNAREHANELPGSSSSLVLASSRRPWARR
jgi:hypothetical protein